MNPKIKQRIAQIREGKIPDKYVKRQDGIFPVAWKEKNLSPFICEYNEKTTMPNQYPVLTSSRKGLMLQTDYYTNRQVTTENNMGYNVLPFHYITFRSRSDDGRFVFNENRIIDKGIISCFYPVFSFTDTVSQDFMIQLLNFSIYRKMYPYIEGTAQQVLSLKKLGRLSYALPDYLEQKRIAEILMTQDRVIALKERYLEEKRRQKKYLMQVLLTGKKRLPGFNDTWQNIPAKRIFVNISDKHHSCNLPVLSATQDRGIIPRDIVNIDIKYDRMALSGYKKVCPGSFVISLRSFQGGIEYSEYAGLVSPAYTVLSPCKKICNGYYKQFFKSENYIRKLNVAVYGIRDGKQISYADFGRISIPYPPFEEQKAIEEILSTADKEISLLQRELEQERQKKKALMQLLLSGIVRTV